MEEDTYQNMGNALPDSHDIPVPDLYKIIQAELQENPVHPFKQQFEVNKCLCYLLHDYIVCSTVVSIIHVFTLYLCSVL